MKMINVPNFPQMSHEKWLPIGDPGVPVQGTIIFYEGDERDVIVE